MNINGPENQIQNDSFNSIQTRMRLFISFVGLVVLVAGIISSFMIIFKTYICLAYPDKAAVVIDGWVKIISTNGFVYNDGVFKIPANLFSVIFLGIGTIFIGCISILIANTGAKLIKWSSWTKYELRKIFNDVVKSNETTKSNNKFNEEQSSD